MEVWEMPGLRQSDFLLAGGDENERILCKCSGNCKPRCPCQLPLWLLHRWLTAFNCPQDS